MKDQTISRRQFLLAGGAGLAALTLGLPRAAQAAGLAGSRPNIIYVMTDDQGYGELACHGNPIIKTPNLDKFYGESLRLTDYHVSPTCAPTRSSLMSGKHEFKNGVTHTILERERMSLKTTTLPQVLKSAGYATGIFGKWHLGDEEAYQPGRRGFDEVYIHGAGGIGQTYPGTCGDAPENSYFGPYVRHNGTFVKTEKFCTDVFFDQAMRWIGEKARGGAPFFAYITPNAPHGPYVAPEEYKKMYAGKGLDENAIGYYGMITNIDDNFGRLVARLKELGIERNTLLIFTTDNGHSVGSLYNAGMHGNKGTPYEGGVRVPCFMRWGDKLPAGADCDALTAHVDMFPTFAELAGASIPEPVRAQQDGRSLVPLMQDPKASWADRFLFTHVGRWPRGANVEEFKLKNCSVRDARFRLVNNAELYDVKADPGETKNVIEQHPEELKKLRGAYDKWWAEVVPCLENENAPQPKINPYQEAFFKQFGGEPSEKDKAIMAGPWPATPEGARKRNNQGKGAKKQGKKQGKKQVKQTQP